jgi:hypothetical protein
LGKKKINDFQVGCQDIEQVVKQWCFTMDVTGSINHPHRVCIWELAMVFGLTVCILVCNLNSLCPWKSSASSGWNVNSCLEKKIEHSDNNIIFIVWVFYCESCFFPSNEWVFQLLHCANLCTPFQVGLIDFTSCWFSLLPSHLFWQLNTAIYYQCWAVLWYLW